MELTLGSKNIHADNSPIWNKKTKNTHRGFHEAWYLRLSDDTGHSGLWLRFSLLISANGFRKLSDIAVLIFKRSETGETVKTALRQSFRIDQFQLVQEPGIRGFRLGECEFTDEYTRGKVESKSHVFKWNLRYQHHQRIRCEFVPRLFSKLRIIRNSIQTIGEDLRFNGTTELDGQVVSWKNGYGMQGHFYGERFDYQWIWAHANCFYDQSGHRVPCVFEGYNLWHPYKGFLPYLRVSAFLIYYQGKPYRFNSLSDLLRLRSEHGINEWSFQAERGDLSFRGRVYAELKDFAGVTYENTDGTYLHAANTQFASMELHVYRKGKLEKTFLAPHTVGFELARDEKNPYVSRII